MKILYSILASVLLVFVLTSCFSEEIDISETIDTASEFISDLNLDESDTGNSENISQNYEWREFLNDYELWVNKYIDISKKYSANPADISIMSEYFDMLTELTEWTTKTEEMQQSLSSASAAELAEYSAKLARIARKLSEVY